MRTFGVVLMGMMPFATYAHTAALTGNGDASFPMGGMMQWGSGMMYTWGILSFLTWIIWLVAGILVIVWLWQHIDKK